jgi:hypothetical protein
MGFTVLGVSGDRAVWYTGQPGTEIWSSRLDGSGSVRLAGPQAKDGARVSTITLAGDHVVWGMAVTVGDRTSPQVDIRYVGLYRTPVTGGPAELIPDSDGYVPSWELPGLAKTITWAGDPPATGKVWDLASGDRRTWTRNPLIGSISCGMDWCGGTNNSRRAAVQHRDGSGYVELPLEGTVYPLIGGRFALVVSDKPHTLVPAARQITASALWDLKTGRVSNLGPITLFDYGRNETPALVRSFGIVNLLFAWEQGGEVVLLDLSRIP